MPSCNGNQGFPEEILTVLVDFVRCVEQEAANRGDKKKRDLTV